jgi:hypothetical protein
MVRPVERRDLALAALLVAVGFGAWLLGRSPIRPSTRLRGQSEWSHVLGFSLVILALMGGCRRALARSLSQARSIHRLSLTLIAAGTLAAVTNIVALVCGLGGPNAGPGRAKPDSPRLGARGLVCSALSRVCARTKLQIVLGSGHS